MLPLLPFLLVSCASTAPAGVIDTHLHGATDPVAHLDALRASGITTVMVSTSWEDQQRYDDGTPVRVLRGLMFPCPRGKVPYSSTTGSRRRIPVWIPITP